MFNSSDTIVAPITPPGPGPVAILRVSGEKTAAVGTTLLRAFSTLKAAPRELLLSEFLIPAELRAADEGERLDSVMAAYFKAPNSFTGEDVLEINLHGSSYIVARALELITALGVRPAKPGEFSERAFHNGKIDLTEAEAICDLINSETKAQHRVAEQQLSGKVSETVLRIGEPLRDLLAEIEAHIDFPDEDIDPLTYVQWSEVTDKIKIQLELLKSSFKSGKILREGALVVLAGLPNAGKSSLLNRILGENRAIVTPIAGTTRDSIEEICSIEGLKIRLCDTAGLDVQLEGEQSGRKLDEVEQLGVNRSWELIQRAELVLFLTDPTQDQKTQLELLEKVRGKNSQLVIVCNKSDLLKNEADSFDLSQNGLKISATTGEGIATLTAEIAAKLIGETRALTSVVIASERHFNCLSRATADLNDALIAMSSKQPAEIISFHVRAGLNSLQEIVGVTENEEILGRIFSKFCIGK